MHRASTVLRLLPLLAFVVISGCRAHHEAVQPHSLRPLNVMVVTIDTLRPDHLGCYGYRRIETPVLDRFAVRGTLFENAIAQSPLTPPSHASIFTGQNPNVHGVRNIGGFSLPASARPLARILQERGWDTAAFVSSVALKKTVGLSNGFAIYDDEMPKPAGRDLAAEPERRAGDTIDRALTWLATQSGRPYFLWVHLYDPHRPYDLPPAFKAKYRDQPYDGEIAYADQQLGRLFEAVEKKSPGNTVTTVLSDHGESLSEHGEFTHGVFLYDATLRIAFMIAGPGIPAGLRIPKQVRSIDVLPTVLALLDAPPPAGIAGTNLLPGLAGKKLPEGPSYAETLYPKINMGWAELRAVRTIRWKYIRAPKPELYNLAADPGETTNVIAQNPAQARNLDAQLEKIVGNSGPEKIQTNAVDRGTMEKLKSLGYVSGFSPRQYELAGRGADPKDRIGILKVIEEAERPESYARDRRIALFQNALRTDDTNPMLYFELGRAFERHARYGDAQKLYEAALAKGIESATLHARMATLALRAGDRDRAIREYEKALSLDPMDLESQINLATAYLESGKIADAQRGFQFVLGSDPRSAAAHNGLGLVALRMNDPGGARSHFEEAVQVDPDLVEAQMNLGLLYEMAGDRERARACFRAFLARASRQQYGSLFPKVKRELAGLE
jgi:choline-sulfatase